MVNVDAHKIFFGNKFIFFASTGRWQAFSPVPLTSRFPAAAAEAPLLPKHLEAVAAAVAVAMETEYTTSGSSYNDTGWA